MDLLILNQKFRTVADFATTGKLFMHLPHIPFCSDKGGVENTYER